tara:strand:+ start:2529 stop:2939 length:411 start_codon:yes stop_codon:yes gene_type:complete
MNDYMGASVREAQIIQTANDAANAARDAANSVHSMDTNIQGLLEIVEEIQRTYLQTEGQVISLRNDISILSEEVTSLKVSVDDAMVPTIDTNSLELIIAIIAAFTLCIIICQFLVFYANYQEKKTIQRRIHANNLL